MLGKLTYDCSKLVKLLLDLGHTSQLHIEFALHGVDLLINSDERQRRRNSSR